ncbi:hypothetical protein [Microbacterium rhizomatis]|uniref:Glycosyltransferase family 39 protein n=1 Tax=Microbacterium rhizomatis TaxID=1631477 RepID=A0A5J5J8W3_9MICO|nr:hypothetical protein [Microbacterium rhizomatis]KAA9111233.1 hypothetical protein F6B43_06470 [Microbacterium rhizomatis]
MTELTVPSASTTPDSAQSPDAARRDRSRRAGDEGRPSGRRATIPRWVVPAALIVGCLVVFAAHFRPWEVAYMEEWPLARDWMGGGALGFASNYVQWTLSRPLHLLPTMLGLAIGGGWPGMIFLVLALVAVGQLLAVMWALRPMGSPVWLNVAVGLFLALHPLWPGGYLQRFLPAQTAALALAIAIGMFIRWLLRGRVRWLVWGAVVLLAGLATYPGPAAVAPLAAVVLALAVKAPWRRGILLAVTATATSALMTFYSLVVTRFISPDAPSYEIGNIQQAAVGSLHDLITYVETTLLRDGPIVLAGIAAIAVLGAVLALSGAIPHPDGWLIAGTALVSPVTTIVFFGNTGWLSDIDRLGYVISLALFAALMVWPIARTGLRPALSAILASALILASLAGGAVGIRHWQPYIAAQHLLLTELGPVVREAGPGEVVTVIDRSGSLGLFPSFPLQYLGPASVVWNHDDTPVWLCFEPPTPVPGGGSVCDPKDTGVDMRLIRSVPLSGGVADIYIGRLE